MSRDEGFNDIPDLGPARDDLDHSDIPTLKPSSPTQNSAYSRTGTARPVARSSKGLVFCLVCVVLASVAFGYWSFDQLAFQNKQLMFANQSIEKLQSRLTDFESLVSAADDSANKSGAALQAQLGERIQKSQARIQHVDSEIRKLWAIYQKYQPTIVELEEQQKTIAGSLDNVGLSLDKQSQSIGSATNKAAELEKQIAQLNKDFTAAEKQYKSEFTGLAEQLLNQDLASQEVNETQSAQLTSLKSQLKTLSINPQLLEKLQASVVDQQKSLDSINAHRRQINSEVLRLKNRIGQLQPSADVGQ